MLITGSHVADQWALAIHPFTIEQDALILLALLVQLDDVPQYPIDGLCSIGNNHTIGWEDFNDMEKMGLFYALHQPL